MTEVKKTGNVSVNERITDLLNLQGIFLNKFKDNFFEGLHVLLNGNYVKYAIGNQRKNSKKISEDELQSVLYKLNEKTEKRRKNGVYYTPTDVVSYITYNSLVVYSGEENHKTYNENDAFNLLKSLERDKIEEIIFKTTLIDPTCGTGEFVLTALDIKIRLLLALDKRHTDDQLLEICKTVFGNDIDDESIDISKTRVFLKIGQLFKEEGSFVKLAQILNGQFFVKDFICKEKPFKNVFDIVVGNPPYVEYRKFENKKSLLNNFGNVFADAIKNSLLILKNNGVLGFIVPLSYVSTKRMGSIRDYVKEQTSTEFILSFADRPDCLFDGVHQKLNILITKRSDQEHKTYTSNYKHWSKSERKELLNGREIIFNRYRFDQYIPKIGNSVEADIFNKIYKDKLGLGSFWGLKNDKDESFFLNMRACFWIKAFSFNPGSSEYKPVYCSKKMKNFGLCLLNSSLFWLFWTIVSDGWHITKKDLDNFWVPDRVDNLDDFKKLAVELEDKLNKTKKYIGSKQTDYEYKHKYCKDIIDKIDDKLASIYKLDKKERGYVKSFALKYRLGVHE